MLSLARRDAPGPLARTPAPRPFAPTLDRRFLYPSRAYAEVLGEVQRALQQREGLVVVTGEPGTGKTLLCRALLDDFGAGACVSVVLDPKVTIEDLLLHVLADFGAISSPRQLAAAGAPTRHQLVRALQQFLASLIPVWGCAVLVVDEAQDLETDVLEQLRLLLNFETNQTTLLQIVLVGQPSLHRRLQEPSLRQLDERVARRCSLEPLPAAEVARYIEHRVATAQRLLSADDGITIDVDASGPAASPTALTFTPAAVRLLAAQSKGVPRAINRLCDRALEVGAERGASRVDWRIARAAVRRVHPPAVREARLRLAARPRLATAAAAAAAAISLGTWTLSAGSAPPAAPAPPTAFAPASAGQSLFDTVDVKPLPVAPSYNVRVASFRFAGTAMDLSRQLQDAGLPAFTRSGRPGVHEVVVGPYLSESDVAAVRQRLAASGLPERDVFVERFEDGGLDVRP